uniref:Uncharacterized protein n=1 Tax=Candidatus Kentrum sp. LPFa TaxID=2126335 RepID=A0A450W4T4_9GAMM|nr:MAG: hypothetical protein BECKLPF1236B_GA0070989_102916 [Candidatus Kentron sp. LPFa]
MNPHDANDIITAYRRCFSGPLGEMVAEDIRQSFLLGEPISPELSDIPHPYREYAVLGMRMAAQKILGIIEMTPLTEKKEEEEYA